jgi:hypothetical protein
MTTEQGYLLSKDAVRTLEIKDHNDLKIIIGPTKLVFKDNGEMYHNGKLIETDKELVDSFRELIATYKITISKLHIEKVLNQFHNANLASETARSTIAKAILE